MKSNQPGASIYTSPVQGQWFCAGLSTGELPALLPFWLRNQWNPR